MYPVSSISVSSIQSFFQHWQLQDIGKVFLPHVTKIYDQAWYGKCVKICNDFTFEFIESICKLLSLSKQLETFQMISKWSTSQQHLKLCQAMQKCQHHKLGFTPLSCDDVFLGNIANATILVKGDSKLECMVLLIQWCPWTITFT